MAKQKNQQVADVEEQTDQVEGAEPEAIEEGETASPGRRLPHVPPEQFAALRDELKMSNKEVAQAIDRTVARVSELTYSQGASIQTWERYEADVRAWREANPIQVNEGSADNDDESSADES